MRGRSRVKVMFIFFWCVVSKGRHHIIFFRLRYHATSHHFLCYFFPSVTTVTYFQKLASDFKLNVLGTSELYFCLLAETLYRPFLLLLLISVPLSRLLSSYHHPFITLRWKDCTLWRWQVLRYKFQVPAFNHCVLGWYWNSCVLLPFYL